MSRVQLVAYGLVVVTVAGMGLILHVAFVMTNLDKHETSKFTNIERQGCFISFKVEHQDSVAIVVMRSEDAHRLIIENYSLLAPITPVALYDIIRYDIALDISQSSFQRLKRHMVKADILSKYQTVELINDTTVVVDGRLNERLENQDYHTIIYLLLKQNVACCVANETGTTFVAIGDPKWGK